MKESAQIPEITFRKVTLADVDLVFAWSNDVEVRAQSFSSEPIVYEKHVIWFGNKMLSAGNLFLIGEVEKEPAGLVRFEGIPNKTVIGILLDAKFRGKGLSSRILLGALGEYFSEYDAPVAAFIKKTNAASRNAFAKAGFTFVKDVEMNGWPSVELVLTKKAYAENGTI